LNGAPFNSNRQVAMQLGETANLLWIL